MAEDVLVVLSTFGSPEQARQVGRTLVEEHLAACVNLLPQVESIYRWKQSIDTAQETIAIFKIADDRYFAFEQRLRELHSYEVPEIISLRVQNGHFPYLQWVDESCRPPWQP